MRSTLALTATVLVLAWAAPASAQMCGGGQATGATASASTPATGGGMMCGMGQRAATDPMTETRSPSQQSAQGGCPCCRHMAMMQGGMGGMMGGGQRPPQQGSQPSQPSAPSPSMPDMPGMTPRPQ
jgi:hypothetical protein